MPQNVETYLRNLHTSDTVRADAWDALHSSDDPKVVEQRLRNVRGLTDNLKAKLWDLKFPAAPAAEPTEPADPYDANALTKAVGMGRSFLGGIGQGVASTALHLDDLRRDATEYLTGESQERPLDNPNVKAAITPYNTPSKVGFASEQIGEFALPGGAVAKGVSKIPKVANAGRLAQAAAHAATQAPVAGVIASAQQGDVKAATVPAVISGATPFAGAAVRGFAESTLYPAVRAAVGEGGAVSKFFNTVDDVAEASTGPVAGQLQGNLDEALQQVRQVGITGGRGDWDKINRWWNEVRLPQAIKAMRNVNNPSSKMQIRKQAQAEFDLLHELSGEMAKYRPETGFSPFGTGGIGYLFGGPQAGVPLAVMEAVRKRFPAWSATQLDRASSLLARPSASGVSAGLEEELLRREMEGR